jgi:hypothetical protein
VDSEAISGRDEIEEHVTLQTEDNIRAGIAPAKAHRQAVLKFGAVGSVRESYHAEEGLPLAEGVLQDFGYAIRLLRKSPGVHRRSSIDTRVRDRCESDRLPCPQWRVAAGSWMARPIQVAVDGPLNRVSTLRFVKIGRRALGACET